jgi:hypothetical protein
MKKISTLLALCLVVFAASAAAQNRIKLFDPTPISITDDNMLLNAEPFGLYKSVQVYLSCSTTSAPTSSVSGPEGGDLIVDNYLIVNSMNVCGGHCFQLTGDPGSNIGMPVETAYSGLAPVNVSSEITGTGLYTFLLLDYGQVYGNSAIYLNTSCSIIPINTPTEETPTTGGNVVCHRNNGNRGSQTLTLGPGAIDAHLAHGDTLGPCGQ